MIKYPCILVCGWLWQSWGIFWFLNAFFGPKNIFSESLWRRASYVTAPAVLIFLIFAPEWIGLNRHRIDCPVAVDYLGVLITLCGLTFAARARNHLGKYWSSYIALKDSHKLIRTGPYRYVRHPIYTGILAGMFGTALTVHTYEAVLGITLNLMTFVIRIWREDKFMAHQFGEAHAEFRNEVPLFVPKISRMRFRNQLN